MVLASLLAIEPALDFVGQGVRHAARLTFEPEARERRCFKYDYSLRGGCPM